MTGSPEPRLGRYEVRDELGRGTTAVVYQAWDAQLDRIVAIKIFRPDIACLHGSDARLRGRFQQEAMAAGRLTHRSIVGVYDFGEVDGTPYIVMEYVAGRTLADLVTGGPVPAADAVPLALQLCDALDYAHGRGVVHRDIKPGNILVGDDGVAKLADFGIARIVGLDLTQTGAMLGTPAYMAPEQVKGQAADATSDVFALGVVLYEALTGVSPFQRQDIAAVLYQIVHVDPVRPRERHAAISPALDAVVMRALAKEAAARYPSARALGDALAQALESPSAVADAPWRAGRRGRSLVALRSLVAAALGGMLIVGFVAWTRSGSVPEPDPPAPRLAEAPARETGATLAQEPVTPEPVAATSTAIATSPPVAVEDPSFRIPRPPEPPPARRPAVVLAPSPTSAPVETPPARPDDGERACLSVNALPFAAVYVDGRLTGHTPKACLRVPPGERRVYFEASGERSPERVVRVTSRHTVEDPVRLSYDFTIGRFVDE